MRRRCLYDPPKAYKEKRIKICERWLNSYDAFVEDMGERPQGTTLDRIDPNGDYEPANCRWVDWRTQENNKEDLTKIEYNGEIHTIGEWAYILGLNKRQLQRAYKRHAEYGCKTFDEIFFDGHLVTKRVSERQNKCKVCGTSKSCKWRKNGTLCNTCYHREYRALIKRRR
ncbi:hypothetical protein [Nitratiruptor sp. SB155-2]|uniref:hypothetical protein n=1 Tax=Nitratiruptor sp. (strain SB155-2) TaxID=387092 RepID=UPI0011D0C91E|nr:hypothetical protein [Nitratiruptor sp. SB155-2]